MSAQNGGAERLVEAAILDTGDHVVQWGPGMRGIEDVVVLRPADASMWLEAMDVTVSGGVRSRHVR